MGNPQAGKPPSVVLAVNLLGGGIALGLALPFIGPGKGWFSRPAP